MNVQPLADRFIRAPNCGEAGSFCCHRIETKAKIHAQVGYSRADDFQNLVFAEA